MKNIICANKKTTSRACKTFFCHGFYYLTISTSTTETTSFIVKIFYGSNFTNVKICCFSFKYFKYIFLMIFTNLY